MAERGIIFSAPMVQALLTGRKSQTRRVIRDAPNDACWHCDRRDGKLWFVADGGSPSLPVRLGFTSGDRLWVRETWADVNTDSGPALAYRAGGIHFCADDAYPVEYERYPGCSFCMWWGDLERGEPDHRWRSPIHMPRWASRLTLAVTDVRVQRVQDISEADARAEGCSSFGPAPGDPHDGVAIGGPEDAYRDLWNSIHGREAWDANPWVVAISFDVRHGMREAQHG